MCDAIRTVIEMRINMRFDVMSPKIPLTRRAEAEILQRLMLAAARDTVSPDDKHHLTANDKELSKTRRFGPRNLDIGDTKYCSSLPPSRRRRIVPSGKRQKRAPQRIDAFIKNFNLVRGIFVHEFVFQSRIDDLILDYSLLSNPTMTAYGIEMTSSGETSWNGYGGTPFAPPTTITLEEVPNGTNTMLQLLVTDYVPNTLMYHGHRSVNNARFIST
jgi:hypothetical protein